MPPQVWTFYLYLVLAGVIAAVFGWVAWTTRNPREVAPAAANRLRFGFFVLITVILVATLGLTLTKTPYELWADEVPDRVVFVAGKNFAFAVSETPVETVEEWEEQSTTGETVVVPAGSLIEFRVSSFDVNHSIGVYDPDGVLIGQIQGMPGYISRFRLRFEQPGRYDLLCLELCGMGHVRMRGVVMAEGAV